MFQKKNHNLKNSKNKTSLNLLKLQFKMKFPKKFNLNKQFKVIENQIKKIINLAIRKNIPNNLPKINLL